MNIWRRPSFSLVLPTTPGVSLTHAGRSVSLANSHEASYLSPAVYRRHADCGACLTQVPGAIGKMPATPRSTFALSKTDGE